MKISFSSPTPPKAGTLVLTVAQERALGPFGTALDGETGGAIGRAMEAARFTGKADETLTLLAPSGTDLSRIVLLGLGAPAGVTAKALQSAGGAAMAALAKAGTEVALAADAHDGIALPAAEVAAHLALGLRLRSFRFDKYKTRTKDNGKDGPRKVNVLTDAAAAAKKAFAGLDAVADGVFLTRELGCEPANVLYPETLAERCAELSKLGVEVDVLDEKRMRKLGMGALLGVAQGSVNGPRLVVMRWNGNGAAQPVAFVGKGVTFDTGGISIKPAGGMEDMKYDMCGAAAVIGLMRTLAGRKAKANVVGIVGLVENMPDGKAQRPGDIVTSMSGQTIEVLNTDAEGRLVLADALWYTQAQIKPRCMIDLATLTGAIVVSLGGEYAGLFSNNDELAAQITEAGKASGEEVWRMPLGAAYDRDIDSDHADMKNIGSPGKAGSIIGAVFLQRFVNDLPWAHIDIAGTAWSKKDTTSGPKGATGFGVRLLDRLVRTNFEG